MSTIVYDVQIERVNTFNFLGILLDESLTWADHTNMVANKISRVTGVLHRLTNIFSTGNITNIIQHTNTVIHKLWTISLGCEIQ